MSGESQPDERSSATVPPRQYCLPTVREMFPRDSRERVALSLLLQPERCGHEKDR